ncbi:sulfatase [Ruficoccus amylovorans]|uniref:Sulfatase n=1 Tax=Ruficoccus amylovorans TaxID=1804625 RepID=A0A842HG36_9BACT|nr:sulfatase [Ruficoccus amylovorans]MBC2595239.1 sulfatase [Ruficoccus amylovorans]
MKSASLFCRHALAAFSLFAAGSLFASDEHTTPRNIVFILVDDLGYADINTYGGSFAETPNLNRLASQSMRFTQAYAPAPICSASRASILTGQTPARLGFEFVVQARTATHPENTPLVEPPYPRNLPLDSYTMGEAFSEAGFVTGYFGKWHLSEHKIPENPQYLGYGPTHGPAAHHFQETDEDRGSHPYGYSKTQKRTEAYGDFADGTYEPDSLTDKALDFMARHRNERFFLFLGQYYVHTPVSTRCEWLFEKYRQKAEQLGLPYDKEAIKYAAFIDTMDHLIGRVMNELDALGLADDTMLVFTVDNGGMPLYADNGHLRGSKWTLYEGGLRVPLMVRWPGHIPADSVSEEVITGTDLFATFCDAAGIATPDSACDGRSFFPLLEDNAAPLPERAALIWHFPFYHPQHVGTRPCSAIRKGDMKLVYFYEDDSVELYNLKDNPGESRNLASSNRKLATAMTDELMQTLREQDARFPVKRTSASTVQ